MERDHRGRKSKDFNADFLCCRSSLDSVHIFYDNSIFVVLVSMKVANWVVDLPVLLDFFPRDRLG